MQSGTRAVITKTVELSKPIVWSQLAHKHFSPQNPIQSTSTHSIPSSDANFNDRLNCMHAFEKIIIRFTFFAPHTRFLLLFAINLCTICANLQTKIFEISFSDREIHAKSLLLFFIRLISLYFIPKAFHSKIHESFSIIFGISFTKMKYNKHRAKNLKLNNSIITEVFECVLDPPVEYVDEYNCGKHFDFWFD